MAEAEAQGISNEIVNIDEKVDMKALEAAAWDLVGALGKSGEVARPFSTFTTTSELLWNGA